MLKRSVVVLSLGALAAGPAASNTCLYLERVFD